MTNMDSNKNRGGINSPNVMPVLIYLAAFSSCISIAGSNAMLGLMFILFIYHLIKERNWKALPKDWSFFPTIYAWKGITILANGAGKAIIEVREVWDKLPYLIIGSYSISEDTLRKMFHVLFATNAFLAVYAMAQKYMGFPVIVQPLFHENRLVGYFGNGHHYAGFMAIVIITCLALSIYYKRAYAWYLPFLILGEIRSLSRTYIIATFFCLLLIASTKSKKVFVIVLTSVLSIGVAIAAAFHSATQHFSLDDILSAFEIRKVYWDVAIENFMQNPIFGVGYEQFSKILLGYYEQGLIPNPAHSHNLYLEELVEGGVIGFILITSMIVYFIRKYYLQVKSDESSDKLFKSLSLALLASFICIALAGIFEYNFGAAVVWIQLTFTMGIAEGYRKWLMANSKTNLPS